VAVEREIKLRCGSADEARAKIVALGATPLRGRRLQADALLDTEDGRLQQAGSALRVRTDGPTSVLTFKGPVAPGLMKVRDEHETMVADGDTLLRILSALGLRIGFRYEKYREEFAADGVVIAVDETPVGAFVEIEGDEAAIHRVAQALGRSPDDYITASYRLLFLEHRASCGLTGPDMLFPAPAGA